MKNLNQIPKGSLIAYMGNLVKQHGGINMAQGIPGFQPPKELLDILNILLNENVHQYPPSSGNFELIELLKTYYRSYYSFSTNNFLVVQGATEAISLIYTYLFTIIKNAKVLVFDPPYESFVNLPKIFQHKTISFSIPFQGEIDLTRLEKFILSNKVNIIFICSPGNPFGKNFSSKEINKIIEIARENNIYIIFDHVYKEIYFSTESFCPLTNYYENLFYVNSFSKSLSVTGWRIGYFIAHESHMDKIKPIHDYIGLCAPSLLQEAITRYLVKYNFGIQYILKIREKLTSNFHLIKDALVELKFKVPEIDGGYFVWAELPYGMDESFNFAVNLYENEKVAIIPGIHFSENTNRFIRINIGLETEKVEKGITGIRNYFRNN